MSAPLPPNHPTPPQSQDIGTLMSAPLTPGVVAVKATDKLDWPRSKSNSLQEIQENRITTYKRIGLHHTRESDYIIQENRIPSYKRIC